MHTATLKKWALALTFWLALHMASLKAQTLPFQLTASGVDFEWRLDGSIIEEGSGSSTLSNADLESGSRFIWYPALSALRAGYNSTETVSEVGQYSVAMGYHTTASGTGSTALGGSAASGNYSTALGSSTASGNYSTALGGSTASGNGSTALGYGTSASGYDASTAMGWISQAPGFNGATAMGYWTLALGPTATTMGFYSFASGPSATAMGNYTTASGSYSTSMGNSTTADAYESVAMGQFNVGGGTSATWVATDPLFEIGNGTSTYSTYSYSYVITPSDAFVVYKNGNAIVQGVTTSGGGFMTTAASVSTTDIPMYSGD